MVTIISVTSAIVAPCSSRRKRASWARTLARAFTGNLLAPRLTSRANDRPRALPRATPTSELASAILQAHRRRGDERRRIGHKSIDERHQERHLVGGPHGDDPGPRGHGNRELGLVDQADALA